MRSLASTASFGSSKTGLSTVGYTVYDSTGGVSQARTTSGIVELLAGSGIYRTIVSVADTFKGFVLWDTGDGATVRYAADSINPDIGESANTVDDIRTLLRGLNASIISHIDRALKRKQPAPEKIDLKPLGREILAGIDKAAEGIKRSFPAPNHAQSVDLKGVFVGLEQVKTAIKAIRLPEPEKVDLGGVSKALEDIQDQIEKIRIPSLDGVEDSIRNLNGVVTGLLPAKQMIMKQTQELHDVLLRNMQTYADIYSEIIKDLRGDLLGKLSEAVGKVAIANEAGELRAKEAKDLLEAIGETVGANLEMALNDAHDRTKKEFHEKMLAIKQNAIKYLGAYR